MEKECSVDRCRFRSPVPAEARYFKNVLGGLLIQDCDRIGWEADQLEVADRAQLRLSLLTSLLLGRS